MEHIEEGKRWFAQARRDLKAAHDSAEAGNYEWCCFQAQQVAEKAVKALLHVLGRHGWGHSVVELLGELRGVNRGPRGHIRRRPRARQALHTVTLPQCLRIRLSQHVLRRGDG
ncbi:MAG: HEPN domain-containing protein [Thermofilum sp.]|nr:HEPN domain-containing protein [Thermofilum sp.]